MEDQSQATQAFLRTLDQVRDIMARKTRRERVELLHRAGIISRSEIRAGLARFTREYGPPARGLKVLKGGRR